MIYNKCYLLLCLLVGALCTVHVHKTPTVPMSSVPISLSQNVPTKGAHHFISSTEEGKEQEGSKKLGRRLQYVYSFEASIILGENVRRLK